MQNRLGAEAYDLYKKGCEPEFNEDFFRNADEAREKATIKDDWSEPIVEWISKLKDGIRFNENDIYKAVFHKELETYSEAYKRIQRILSDLKYKKIINIMANSIIRKLSKNHIYFILFQRKKINQKFRSLGKLGKYFFAYLFLYNNDKIFL